MRFAYIDSQGNEVAIPSVDALALRIKLGAVKPDTQLYDGQADQWGPAESHEIFHTLARDTQEDGFVPPPPVAPPPAPQAVEEPESEDPVAEFVDPDEVATVGDLAPEPLVEATEAREEADLDFGLLASEDEVAPPEPMEAAQSPVPGGADEFSPFVGDDDQALTDQAPDATAEATAASGGGAFDFGDLGTGLEVEPPEEEPPAMPAIDHEQEPLGSGVVFTDDSAADDFGFGGGIELESAMDFAGGGGAVEDSLDLGSESGFTPETGPALAGPAEGDTDAGLMDFTPGPQEDEAPALEPNPKNRQPREPRNRPSPPKHRRAKSRTGPFLGFVLLVAVGGGGYYAWQNFGTGVLTPQRPPVVIPVIPEELLPLMRQLAGSAIEEMFADVESRAVERGVLTEPPEEWLAGIYLANASSFPAVEEFWTGIGAFADMIRDLETSVFHDEYAEQLEGAEVGAAERVQMAERADSGFVATQPSRYQAYALLDEVTSAALDLHAFLVTNESAIVYTPASGLGGNPVEEAVPNTEELSDQMWDMVDDITSALDALGTLDRVTRDRLLSVLYTRIEAVGIQ